MLQMPQGLTSVARMTRGRGFGLGTIAGCVLALTVSGTAWACPAETYMTPEQLASGLYDTTPPPWDTGSGGAPATDPAAPSAPTGDTPPAPASVDSLAAAPKVTASKPQAGRSVGGDKPAGATASPKRASKPTAASPDPAPVALAPKNAQTQAPQSARTQAPQPATPAAVEPKAQPSPRQRSASARKARRTPIKSTRFVPTQMARMAEPAGRVLEPPRPTATGEHATAPGNRTPWTFVAMLLVGLTGIAGVAAVLRRRGGPAAPVAIAGPINPPDHDAELEAALQEMVSEERARTLMTDGVAPHR
jgi:hypothetical protein